MTPEQFLSRCPSLWHVAPAGAWEPIESIGLLTAAQLIDAADLDDEARTALHGEIRPESVALHVDGHDVVLRDQSPLLRGDLAGALAPGFEISDWVKLLNRRVYLYTDRAVLRKALDAPLEAGVSLDVITFSPRRLLDQAKSQIELSARSTGTTIRKADPDKGRDTFVSISRFPDKKPAEVTIVDGLDDLSSVVRVERHDPDGTRTPLR